MEAQIRHAGLSVAALIVGIVSLAATIVYIAVPATGRFMFVSVSLGIIAVVIGFFALSKHQTKWMAVAGIVIGLVSAVGGITIVLNAMSVVGGAATGSSYY